VSYHPALGKPCDYFYHYTTREAAFEHILHDRTLRLSPAHRMRDPLESNPAFLPAEYGMTDDSQTDYDRQAVAMEAGIRLQQLRQCSKVLSMTIDADDYHDDAEVFGRGYARARMWEQYAESHQGVCLMFRRNALNAEVIAQLTSRSPNSWASPVSYTQRGILENPAATLMPSHAGADAEEIVAEHVRLQLPWLFFTKLLDWQSEHEYRFVEFSMDDGFTSVNFGDTLAGVILGCKFPEWQAHGAREVCESMGATLWLMQWDRARPSPVRIGPS
jgi:hypothetical protein